MPDYQNGELVIGAETGSGRTGYTALAYGAPGQVPTPITAAAGLPVSGAQLTPKASYQQIVDATLAASTALTVPTGATLATIQNNGTQPVRWRDDGTAPTASTGMRLAAGDSMDYSGSLSAIRFIREASGVTLDISYYA